jgi:hypothetical protein
MAALSDYHENKLLDHLLGGGDYTSPATHYYALFTAAPSDSGGGTEATGSGYARKAVTNNTTNYPLASDGSKTNGAIIAFTAASGSWSSGSNMTHIGIFDASSGGNLLAWASIDTPFAVASTDTPTIGVGALTFTFTGVLANAARHGLLDLAFGRVSFTRPSTVYAALLTAPPSYTGGGTEVSGGSYARVSITNNTSNFPNASGGSKSNANAIGFATPTADWGVITDLGIYDSSSGGNLLYFKSLTTSRTVLAGQTFSLPVGAVTASLD